MDHEEYIDSLIESGTNVIFMFGRPGVGKTCFLLAIIKYLSKKYALELGSVYNKDGIAYMENLQKELEKDNSLPDPNLPGPINEMDLSFRTDNKEVIFTFLDIAGEDLKKVEPTKKTDVFPSKENGVLAEKINKYLNNRELSVILLCFIDYPFANSQDRFVHMFFSYLKRSCDFNLDRIALIISKWDMSHEKRDFVDFLQSETTQCYLWLNEKVKTPNAFPFSIGKVDQKKNKLIGNINLDYCKDIVDWINKVADIPDTRYREKRKIFEIILQKIKFVLRIFRYLTNGLK